MDIKPKNQAQEMVDKLWSMSTQPRYKPIPKTKKYFIIPKKK
jgi:hypothetical protein